MKNIIEQAFWIYFWVFELFLIKFQFSNTLLLGLIVGMAIINLAASITILYFENRFLWENSGRKWSRIVKIKPIYKPFDLIQNLHFFSFLLFQLYFSIYYLIVNFGIPIRNAEFYLILHPIITPTILFFIISGVVILEIRKRIIGKYYL